MSRSVQESGLAPRARDAGAQPDVHMACFETALAMHRFSWLAAPSAARLGRVLCSQGAQPWVPHTALPCAGSMTLAWPSLALCLWGKQRYQPASKRMMVGVIAMHAEPGGMRIQACPVPVQI